jgi:hypothetical protein
LPFEGFIFQVPFQSGEDVRQADVAANAQKMTQLNHVFLIEFALDTSASMRPAFHMLQCFTPRGKISHPDVMCMHPIIAFN